MSEKTNDERLRILQERLSQIKEKGENQMLISKEEVIEVVLPQTEIPQKEKTPISIGWLKYFILYFLLAFGGYYAFNNIDFSNIFASDKEIKKTQEFVLEYNLNMSGKRIAIIDSFEDESLAKSMASDLNVKGYKCDYFFLPNKSNSNEKVYKVFLGPYETKEEINQWTQNIDGDKEFILGKKMK